MKLLDFNDDAAPGCSSCILPRFLWQVPPPVLKGGEADGRDAVPFHGIWIPGIRCWQSLREREDVGLQAARLTGPQPIDARSRSLKLTLKPGLVVNGGNLDELPGNNDRLTIDMQRGHSDPLPVHADFEGILCHG